MKLSTKSRYGLRVLLQIALDSEREGAVVTGHDLAERQEISEPYLEQIMIPLKRAGLVTTTRGCRGGYRLKKPAREITVLEIIELFEGELVLVKCVNDKQPCTRKNICPATLVWEELSAALRDKARSITLERIVTMAKENQSPEFMI